MAVRFRCHGGGILGLCDLLTEHAEAIEYDLLTLGLDSRLLGTPGLDWWRLKAVIHNLPLSSALHRSVHGTDSMWGLSEHLLATLIDAVQAGNWQRSGGKGKRPDPVVRPGRGKKTTRIGGGTSMTLGEARAWLDRKKGAN